MKNVIKSVCLECVPILLLGLLPSTGVAQQSADPEKPAASAVSTVQGQAATKPTTTSSSDRVVMKIGSTEVTESEIESVFNQLLGSRKMNLNSVGKQHVAELYARMVVLSQLAVNEHLDTSPALKFRIEMQREKLLAEAEYAKLQAAAAVTPEEVTRYYTEHQPDYDTAEVREFLVRKKTTDSDGNVTGLSPEEAKTKAESVRKDLQSGKSPEEVAQDFAEGNDVILVDRKTNTLRRTQMVPALAKATFDTKDGQVTESVDTPDALLVVLVLKHGHLSQQDVTHEIEKKLEQAQLDSKLDELKKKAGVWMDQDYFKQDQSSTASTVRPSDSNSQ